MNLFKPWRIDAPLLVLLISNAWCIWYYEQHPGGFATVVWIYWWQSMVIGIFNVIHIGSLRNFDTGGFKLNDEPVTASGKGCVAAFFLVHYGAFHLAYFVYLVFKYFNGINGRVVMYSVCGFILESFLTYRSKRAYEKTHKVNMSFLFFLPYLRIVPMHLMILLPAFFGIRPSLSFLLLKTFADAVLYFVSFRLFAGKPMSKEELQT